VYSVGLTWAEVTGNEGVYLVDCRFCCTLSRSWLRWNCLIGHSSSWTCRWREDDVSTRWSLIIIIALVTVPPLTGRVAWCYRSRLRR